MVNFEITITGTRNDDGSGKVSWIHQATDGKKYGDYVEFDDYDQLWYDAAEAISTQARLFLHEMYERKEDHDGEAPDPGRGNREV